MKAPIRPLIAIMCIAVRVLSQDPESVIESGSDVDEQAANSNDSLTEITTPAPASTTASKIVCDIRTADGKLKDDSYNEVGSQKK
jgi:hypothetical protein